MSKRMKNTFAFDIDGQNTKHVQVSKGTHTVTYVLYPILQ